MPIELQFKLPNQQMHVPRGGRSVRGRGGLDHREALRQLSKNNSVSETNLSADNAYLPDFDAPQVSHKSTVNPVFLAYSRVSTGQRIPLIQIATAVVQALKDETAVNTIQPMHSGWWIYLKTEMDHQRLVNVGMTIAGRYVQLRMEMRPRNKTSVKITIKDLPLYDVDNSEVLEMLSDICSVQSEVNYSTIWFKGKLTSIRNGDKFVYLSEDQLNKLLETLEIKNYKARISRPVALSQCKRCNQVGHLAKHKNCPALMPEEIKQTIEPFRGASNQLSNLHCCPEGCTLPDGQFDFALSEHHYQFQ